MVIWWYDRLPSGHCGRHAPATIRNSALKLGDNGVVEIVNRNNKTVWRVRASSNLVPSVDSLPDMSDGLGVLEDSTEESNTVGITCVDQTKGKIRLYIGEFICSPDGRFRFGMSDDGDLSLWDQSTYPSIKVWSADTCCSDEDSVRQASKAMVTLLCIPYRVWFCGRHERLGPAPTHRYFSAIMVSCPSLTPRVEWSGLPVVSQLDLTPTRMTTTTSTSFKAIPTLSLSRLSMIIPVSTRSMVGLYFFKMNSYAVPMVPGYLVLTATETYRFGPDSTKVWSAETSVGEPTSVKFSQRGNLIVRTSSGEIVWTSKTANNPGASLSLRNNGNVVITNADGDNIWIVRGRHVPNDSSIS